MIRVWNLHFPQSRVYAEIDTHSAAFLSGERYIIVGRENVSRAALHHLIKPEKDVELCWNMSFNFIRFFSTELGKCNKTRNGLEKYLYSQYCNTLLWNLFFVKTSRIIARVDSSLFINNNYRKFNIKRWQCVILQISFFFVTLIGEW